MARGSGVILHGRLLPAAALSWSPRIFQPFGGEKKTNQELNLNSVPEPAPVSPTCQCVFGTASCKILGLNRSGQHFIRHDHHDHHHRSPPPLAFHFIHLTSSPTLPRILQLSFFGPYGRWPGLHHSLFLSLSFYSDTLGGQRHSIIL